MRTHTTLVTALILIFTIRAQEPTPAEPVTPAVPALPAAGTPAAQELWDTGIEKMLAIGRGTFRSTEAQDSAMMRGAGMGMGQDDIVVDGGWHQDLVWGELEHDLYVRNGGRMVVKVGDGWKLRATKLASGRPAPFTLDPALLFSVLRDLPAAARPVLHVASGKVAGQPVAILSIVLEGDAAAEFVASGAVPEVGGGFGGVFQVGGLGGLVQLPQPEFNVYLSLHVDPTNGDVRHVTARVYEKNEMFGNVVIQVAGPGGGGEEMEEEEEEEEAEQAPAKAGAMEWKNGLPMRKPAKDESMLTFHVDFQQLGLAAAPALDDKSKALLRLR